MQDEDEIIPILHKFSKSTFFTRDHDFYKKDFLHKKYCIVVLNVNKDEVAEYMRLFLRHPEFKTKAKRMSRVTMVSPSGIHYWQTNADAEQFIE